MTQTDPRPRAQMRAMRLVKSRLGLRIAAMVGKRAAGRELPGAVNETVMIPRRGGAGAFRARVYKPLGAKGPLPIVIFYHGGGYATGWPERHHAFFQRIMETRPCIVVAPAFRASIDAPYPAGHDDCYDAMLWVRDNAERLGGAADRIILAGNSSGGGLALSTALRARDTGDLTPTFVMPLYPMVDDRSNRWTALPKDKITWTKEHNVFAWHLLLRDVRAERRYDIPAYAAPARAEDVSNLPPILSFVGSHDIFLDEDRALMNRIREAGGEVTFRVFEGVFHAMEDSAPESAEAREINSWLTGEFARMIDQYCPTS